MLAARALFAFEAHEGTRCEDGAIEPSPMALLGGLLKSEERAVNLQFAENFARFAEAWVKQQNAKGRASRRRR